MADLIVDYTACIVTGGTDIKSRVESISAEYSPMCGEYFEYLYGKRGASFYESACGFLMLDNLLKKQNVNRQELVIARNSDGRPNVINRKDIDFSISHSEGAAFCCVVIGENAAVGADIQHIRNYSREYLTQLARTFMSKSELESFLVCSDKTEYFYTAWTRRESLFKRCGSYPGLTGSRDSEPVQGSFATGVISSCAGRYYYSISLPDRLDEEKK